MKANRMQYTAWFWPITKNKGKYLPDLVYEAF